MGLGCACELQQSGLAPQNKAVLPASAYTPRRKILASALLHNHSVTARLLTLGDVRAFGCQLSCVCLSPFAIDGWTPIQLPSNQEVRVRLRRSYPAPLQCRRGLCGAAFAPDGCIALICVSPVTAAVNTSYSGFLILHQGRSARPLFGLTVNRHPPGTSPVERCYVAGGCRLQNDSQLVARALCKPPLSGKTP